ncbi:hypothetical protein LCGC14_1388130 [marine sediment metagenome]|uniref:Uncharacterized protein n=1 Tax=marine sediment metagenome TaxID=412755 RepID=A0A0F9K0X5_9ZZZZ
MSYYGTEINQFILSRKQQRTHLLKQKLTHPFAKIVIVLVFIAGVVWGYSYLPDNCNICGIINKYPLVSTFCITFLIILLFGVMVLRKDVLEREYRRLYRVSPNGEMETIFMTRKNTSIHDPHRKVYYRSKSSATLANEERLYRVLIQEAEAKEGNQQ